MNQIESEPKLYNLKWYFCLKDITYTKNLLPHTKHDESLYFWKVFC